MAFILIDGAFTADLLATLGDEVLPGGRPQRTRGLLTGPGRVSVG